MRTIYLKIGALSLCVVLLSGCKRYLLLDPPIDKLSAELVFTSDDAAKSAITGIYSRMAQDGFASGNGNSIMALAGISADEFINYNLNNLPYYNNALVPEGNTPALWTGPYQMIYTANAILEGLLKSDKVSTAVKNQAEGEAKFIRAFCYFYLTNLYGALPLNLTTDYRINSSTSRTAQNLVYSEIVQDLTAAQVLLGNDYYTQERVRPNRWAATALLARVYLYTRNYADAEIQSTKLINNTALYTLKSDVNEVFLKNSTEAIWQLMPNVAGRNTNEALLFLLATTPTNVSLTPHLIDAFEPGDKRRSNWVGTITVGTKTYYFPYKFKVGNVATLTEYSMVLRLAEQYLIRAEARINLDKTEEGIKDLNILRARARALPTVSVPVPLPALALDLTRPDALLALERERRTELFAEWGHRWLDLKRTNRADAVLAPLKGSNWQETDVLYPIPQSEINANGLISQNKGY